MAEELGPGKGGGGGPQVVGCTDPSASNYNPLATVSCGPSGPYQVDLGGQLTSGCCIKNNVGSGGGPSGGGIGSPVGTEPKDPNLEIIDLNPILCPTQQELVINLDGTVVDSQGNNLSQECCTTQIVGSPVSFLLGVANKGICMLVNESNPCPTINQLSISPLDQATIIGITSVECCNENVVGQPVYWSSSYGSKGACKLLPISGSSCFFDNIFLNPYLAPNIPPSSNIQQVIGTFNGISTALNEECCTNDVTGFDVTWNTNLNICQQNNPQLNNNVNISLNQEPIISNDCDDLLVSVKLFFKEPIQECNTEEITASILPNNTNITVEQLGIFTSSTDGFNNWVDLGCRLINPSGSTFDVNLNFIGLSNCCDYDIRVDNIRVDCFKEEDRIFWDNKKCPGFNLQRVIDNKKSWVYNPGTFTGVTEQDSIVIKGGDNSLIQGFGVINRTFAPSPDADLPWRYTDYWEQSNILEPHTKQVINSKEMELTFNMCGQCCVEYSPCPPGFTLSAGTSTCFKVIETKQFQDGWDFDFQDGIPYDFMDF